MGKNYYQTLNVLPSADSTQIAAQFRILAFTLHPDKNKQNGQFALATFAFSEVCEAYEVLSTPELKEIYDKYGEELMKTGVPDKKLGFKAGYQFQGNSQEIFEKFFGTDNPFTIALDEHGQQITMLQHKAASMMDAFKKRFSNLTVTVKCTLEEFYYGCKKEIYFERVELEGDGKRQKMAVASKEIHIKPGMGPQNQLEFPGEGHQRVGENQSDLIIQFQQLPHDKFKRFGNDLILEHKISLHDALKAGPIHLKSLSHDQHEISIDEVISPETFRVIANAGMPILNDDPLGPIRMDFQRGNLVVKFDIQFPSSLNEIQKTSLTQILDKVDENRPRGVKA